MVNSQHAIESIFLVKQLLVVEGNQLQYRSVFSLLLVAVVRLSEFGGSQRLRLSCEHCWVQLWWPPALLDKVPSFDRAQALNSLDLFGRFSPGIAP